jgi:LacI family transcriptional regulator
MVDVAREAGVALRTVSRVVNNDPTVGEPLAERVRHTIAALNYQPDERARQLRSGVSATVGAAVRNISDAHPVLRTIEEAARQVGLTLIAMSTEEDEGRERDAIMSMCRRRLDGIIIEPTADDHRYLQHEIDSGLPVVAFDRPAAGVAVDTVLSDNRGGIEAAFEHLVRYGHRRIAYIGDSERIYTGRERANAFRACARQHGNPVDGMVQPGPVRTQRIAEALASIRGGRWPATALVTGNVSTTIEVVRLLGPTFGSMALVGFDDFPLADVVGPGLTVVAQGTEAIGRATVDLLRARTAKPGRPVQTVTVPTELIARGSGEISP